MRKGNHLRGISSRAFAREWPLWLSIATAAVFLTGGHHLLADLSHPVRFTLVLTWLLLVMLFSAFAVVRHAERLADRLREPLGTLVLTLAVTSIEVMIIVATMSTGTGTPSLARDAMFAILVIVLNGLVGLALLIGGLKHHEQEYNLQGASAFLAVILPLSVVSLVLPSFTRASTGDLFSPLQAAILAFVSLALYAVFLGIQNIRHCGYFQSRVSAEPTNAAAPHAGSASEGMALHSVLLAAYIVLLATLSKQFAVPLEFTVRVLGAPVAFAGFVVALLVLAPEAMTAVRAAFGNDLQRSVNVLLGSALATIGLTVPAVITFGLIAERKVVLGLEPADTVLLGLTLFQSTLTFSSSRTNVLFGAVHLLLFSVYLVLMFDR